MDKKALGKRISGLRGDRGLSMQSFAGLVGLHKNAILKIEHGVSSVTYDNLTRIAQCLGVTTSELCADDASEAALSAARQVVHAADNLQQVTAAAHADGVVTPEELKEIERAADAVDAATDDVIRAEISQAAAGREG